MESYSEWIPGDIQHVLDSDIFQDMDHLYGPGEAHEYGQIGECRLGLYPEHQTLVYEDPQVYLVIKKPSRVTLTEAAVFVDTPGETQTSFFAFERDGGFSFIAKPRQLALDQLSGGKWGTGDREEDGPTVTERSNAPTPEVSLSPSAELITEAPTESLVSEVTAPWEETPSAVSRKEDDRELNGRVAETDAGGRSKHPETELENTSYAGEDPAPSAQPTKQRAKRVDLKAARLGRPIQCRATKNGKTITKFPVAEHSKDAEGSDITAWHTVMAFNALADRLCREFEAGEITVGDELKVAGYPQIQVIPDRHGELKQHEVVFAAHVGKVKK